MQIPPAKNAFPLEIVLPHRATGVLVWKAVLKHSYCWNSCSNLGTADGLSADLKSMLVDSSLGLRRSFAPLANWLSTTLISMPYCGIPSILIVVNCTTAWSFHAVQCECCSLLESLLTGLKTSWFAL